MSDPGLETRYAYMSAEPAKHYGMKFGLLVAVDYIDACNHLGAEFLVKGVKVPPFVLNDVESDRKAKFAVVAAGIGRLFGQEKVIEIAAKNVLYEWDRWCRDRNPTGRCHRERNPPDVSSELFGCVSEAMSYLGIASSYPALGEWEKVII